MLFTTSNYNFRTLLTHKIVKAICCGIAALHILCAPGLVDAANPIFDAKEYEDWGLDYPGSIKATDSPAETEAPAERPTPNTPVTQSSGSSSLVGGMVPQDIANSFEQAAVHVIVFYEDGEHMRMPGWIVDAERRIILTFALLKDATKVHISYPQVPTEDPDTMEGSAAVILKYDSNMDVAYLQANSMPKQLSNLSVSKGEPSRPASQERPVPQR